MAGMKTRTEIWMSKLGVVVANLTWAPQERVTSLVVLLLVLVPVMVEVEVVGVDVLLLLLLPPVSRQPQQPPFDNPFPTRPRASLRK